MLRDCVDLDGAGSRTPKRGDAGRNSWVFCGQLAPTDEIHVQGRTSHGGRKLQVAPAALPWRDDIVEIDNTGVSLFGAARVNTPIMVAATGPAFTLFHCRGGERATARRRCGGRRALRDATSVPLWWKTVAKEAAARHPQCFSSTCSRDPRAATGAFARTVASKAGFKALWCWTVDQPVPGLEARRAGRRLRRVIPSRPNVRSVNT